MKKTMLASVFVVVCTLFGVINSSGQTVELRGSGMYYFPTGKATTGGGQTDLKDVKWDKGTGFELQAVFWPTDSSWGVGASIGISTWDIKDYEFSYYDYSYRAAFADTLDGDADLRIFGLSVFWKMPLENFSKKLDIVAETGIQFVSVDSNIEGGTAIADSRGATGWYQTLELDDSIIGLVALGLDYSIVDNVSLFAQVGFNFDIDKGKVKNEVHGLGTYKAGKSEFQNVYGKVGIAFSF